MVSYGYTEFIWRSEKWFITDKKCELPTEKASASRRYPSSPASLLPINFSVSRQLSWCDHHLKFLDQL